MFLQNPVHEAIPGSKPISCEVIPISPGNNQSAHFVNRLTPPNDLRGRAESWVLLRLGRDETGCTRSDGYQANDVQPDESSSLPDGKEFLVVPHSTLQRRPAGEKVFLQYSR